MQSVRMRPVQCRLQTHRKQQTVLPLCPQFSSQFLCWSLRSKSFSWTILYRKSSYPPLSNTCFQCWPAEWIVHCSRTRSVHPNWSSQSTGAPCFAWWTSGHCNLGIKMNPFPLTSFPSAVSTPQPNSHVTRTLEQSEICSDWNWGGCCRIAD